MKKILVIGAHPDDECLGLGGTLKLYSDNGYSIFVLIVADGETARGNSKKKILVREKQAKRASQILGIKKIEFLHFQDQELDMIMIKSISKKIESVIDKWKPEMVFTHFWGDVNQDHRQVFQATNIACRPSSTSTVDSLICYETPSSTEWGLENFKPNFFVNIEKVFSDKIKAINCYSNELRDFPHPRSIESLSNRSVYWGSIAGVKKAEPFIILRKIIRNSSL